MEKLDNKTYDKIEFKEVYFNSEIEVLTIVKKLVLLSIILLVNL